MDVRYPPPRPAEGGDDPDGPPPPPFVRERARRRRRRRWIIAAVIAGAVLVIGVPLLAFGGLLVVQDATDVTSGPDDDAAGEQQVGPPDDEAADDGTADGTPPPRPDPEVPDDERIEAPGTEGLDAVDARIAELLRDIDASEGVMIAYQGAVSDAVTGAPDPDAPDAVFDEVADAARRALDDLAVLRTRLTLRGGDGAAADVRDAYVGHLDAWVDLLTAIEEEPTLLLGETTTFTIDINRTGDDFVRAVDALAATDVDPDLMRYARAIVTRGFSGPETPQV